jgi:hypothetical protein
MELNSRPSRASIAILCLGLAWGTPTSIGNSLAVAQEAPTASSDALPPHAVLRLGTSRYRHGNRIASADGKFAATAGGSP